MYLKARNRSYPKNGFELFLVIVFFLDYFSLYLY
jgi:hypothetical protein